MASGRASAKTVQRILSLSILRRGCRLLLTALALTAVLPRAGAAELGLLDYFQACGIGADAFAKFADDRQVADEELDVIRRIAVRLRDCPADRLQRMTRQEKSSAGRLPLPAEAKDQRGQVFQLQGSVASVKPVADQGGEPLWQCTVTLDGSVGVSPASSKHPNRAVVYAARLPGALLSNNTGQRVALDGVFVKYMPAVAAEPTAVLVAPGLQWRPQSPLGNLEMDFALFEGVSDNSAMMAADHEAFYRLLELAKNADPARLGRDAERLDASSGGLPALFRDPASQRGRLVTFSGTARRVVRVPIDDPAIVSRLGTDHYFEIDLVADGSQNNPLVFCTLDLPGGMPLGGPPSYGEGIEVTGFFLKTWQYPTALSPAEKAASPAPAHAFLQTAPLLIGPSPLWKPAGRGPAEKKNATAAAVGGLLALAMTGVCLLLLHLRQSDQEFSRQVIARE